MTARSITRRDALAAMAALGALAAVPALAHDIAEHTLAPLPPLPGESVYRLDAALQDQDGRTFALSSLRGAPVLAGMFYTSCDKVCPMIFEAMHATLRALPGAERAATRVLMVSFDPNRDSVAVLKKTAQARGCDDRWVLARADDATTRKVAAVLGVQYRRLSDGEYNHSSTVDVLDGTGRIVARSARLDGADPQVVAAIRRMAAHG
ncbi:MAG TPA: SCO family protein [Ramlibacter sp.]